jgi:hypothetical protein
MAWFTTFDAQALFCVFVVKNITLALEGLGAEGVKMDLVIGALWVGFDGIWAETLRQPIEPF